MYYHLMEYVTRAGGEREGKAAAKLALSSPEASEHQKEIPTLYHRWCIKLRCVVYLHGLTES